uniref:Putative DNA repair exonuclease n=1 Tax=viral metagenome TaxID=1070528 RepID=A0A6M3JIW5_9ZZZZ
MSKRLIPFQFHPEGDFIEIVGIADLHYGSKQFLEKKAMKHRAYALAHPDRKVIDFGDATENALPSSPGSSMFQQTCPPSEQREWVKEYYRPMRDRTIAVIASNHSDRSDRHADWTPDETLVSFLDCTYIRWEAVLAVTVGDSRRGQQYLIFVRHKISNSARPSTILNALLTKTMETQACDVYWAAHCHQWLHHPKIAVLPDPRHRRMKVVEQHLVASDAFIDHDASYAEQHNYPLASEGQASVRLYKDRHHVEVVRNLY